ncbi:phosphate-starvation inducible protein [Bacillus phage Stills]|uniref:Phosphate-starvation inducible protein n=1 Tax=Bacillus phage Stills TaxID=1610833 RepID=A0A0E3T5L8_9CAUD|nr:PhoH-like phosphate starvation-inducible [Bacillus phage Stills]AKC02706.1 phosphate-starvation inducible protein [Bacillus phage Stills]
MEIYKGFIHYTSEELNEYLEVGGTEYPFRNNQYVIIDGDISRFNGTELVPLKYEIKSIKPRNDEQKMAFDLLDNDLVPVKLLTGVAGGGKTRMAFEFALKKLLDYHNPIEKILILRNPATVGKDLGLLPGTKEEKLAPWIKTITNLCGDEAYDVMSAIEFDTPAYQQGITWEKTFVIVEEAQMLCNDLFQMLGSRVGFKSQIVFAGDYKQAFDYKYRGEKNGLLNGVKAFENKKWPSLVGLVEMQKSERGDVAQMFADLW